MAALPILTRDQRNGTVFVEDERAGGTLVVLRSADGGEGGIVARSHEPGTVWPMLKAARQLGEEQPFFPEDFLLRLDTSALPSGRLEFEIGSFIEQVQRIAESGAEVIQLDESEARDWGLRAEEERHA